MQPQDIRVCWICHENDPDCPPPCGNIDTLMFHKQCLLHAQSLSYRCPHCNSLPHMEAIARTAVEAFITSLPSIHSHDSFWWRPPSFICLQTERMLNADEADAAERGITCATLNAVRGCASHVIDAGMTHTTPYSIAVFCRKDNAEIGVLFERVAWVGCMGSIRSDGYLASAYKRKIGSLRQSRNPALNVCRSRC